MKSTLWRNGFSTANDTGIVVCLGSFEAENFEEAIQKYMAIHPQVVAVDKFGKGRHAVCGCEVFDSMEGALCVNSKN